MDQSSIKHELGFLDHLYADSMEQDDCPIERLNTAYTEVDSEAVEAQTLETVGP